MELPRDVRLARMLERVVDYSDATAVVMSNLDPIGTHSTSYPFLALARRIDAEYGDVLWFVDYLSHGPDPKDPRYLAALSRLSHEQRAQIAARITEMREDGR